MLVICSQLHTQICILHNPKKIPCMTLYTYTFFVKRNKKQVKEIIRPFVLLIHKIEDPTYNVYLHVMLYVLHVFVHVSVLQRHIHGTAGPTKGAAAVWTSRHRQDPDRWVPRCAVLVVPIATVKTRSFTQNCTIDGDRLKIEWFVFR